MIPQSFLTKDSFRTSEEIKRANVKDWAEIEKGKMWKNTGQKAEQFEWFKNGTK